MFRVAEQDDLSEDLEQLAVMCRVLCRDVFREKFLPAKPERPSQAASKLYLREKLGGSERGPALAESRMIRRIIRSNCSGRKMFVSDEKRYGLAPMAALPGDIVVVLLGCTSATIVRLDCNESYKVIGEAYYDGIMDGEAVLDPYPEGYDCVKQFDSNTQLFYWIYRNEETGELILDV